MMAWFCISKKKDVHCICKIVAIMSFITTMMLLPYSFCEGLRECLFIKVPEYHDFIAAGDFIWRGNTTSQTLCLTYCLGNAQCQALFYIPTTLFCQLQSDSVFSPEKMTPKAEAKCYRKIEKIHGYSCLDIKESNPSLKSGIFRIKPTNKSFTVYCDMETAGGGWTVFQRRIDGSVNFSRSYKEYENGFGNIAEGEFWLGNEAIHLLTSPGTYTLRADMEDFEGEKRYAEYNAFSVDSKSNGFKVTVLGYTGNAGDGFSRMDGSKFSTYDVDQDATDRSDCADLYKGGWWYDYCHNANPNGLYLHGTNLENAKGMCWLPWLGNYYSLKTMTLMFR